MEPSENVKKLMDLLKDNGVQGGSVGSAAIKEAFSEIATEEAGAKKAQAKDLIRKAMVLKSERDKVVKETMQKIQKFDKELGKLLNQIQNPGAPPPPEKDEPEAPPEPA